MLLRPFLENSAVTQACISYGACLESKAYTLAQHIAETHVEELQASPEQHAAASALFRRAAGVYDYANTAFIQQLTSTNQADRYYSCKSAAGGFQNLVVGLTLSLFCFSYSQDKPVQCAVFYMHHTVCHSASAACVQLHETAASGSCPMVLSISPHLNPP